METKKRKDQLENLLDWEREGGRLPEITELFNRKISPTCLLREREDKVWEIVASQVEDGITHQKVIGLKHTTLVNLGLSILDAVQMANKRFTVNR